VIAKTRIVLPIIGRFRAGLRHMATKSSIEWTELSWNSTIGYTMISPDCKSGYQETEQGCGILNGLKTTAPQEIQADCQKSLGMSGSGEKRRHGSPKQPIDD
jgi:hypothetical protein